jgi:hypothetical protein
VRDLLNANKINLHSYFTFDGGTFFAEGGKRVAAVSDINGANLSNYGSVVKYAPYEPFIKLVEPAFRQTIANSDKDVKIR